MNAGGRRARAAVPTARPAGRGAGDDDPSTPPRASRPAPSRARWSRAPATSSWDRRPRAACRSEKSAKSTAVAAVGGSADRAGGVRGRAPRRARGARRRPRRARPGPCRPRRRASSRSPDVERRGASRPCRARGTCAAAPTARAGWRGPGAAPWARPSARASARRRCWARRAARSAVVAGSCSVVRRRDGQRVGAPPLGPPQQPAASPGRQGGPGAELGQLGAVARRRRRGAPGCRGWPGARRAP